MARLSSGSGFETFILCGRGPLPKTVLESGQIPRGEELRLSRREWAFRKDRVAAYTAIIIVVTVIFTFAGLITRDFLEPEIVVINELDGSVPVALDNRSCEVLARQQVEAPSEEIRSAYDRAVRQREIIYLSSHSTHTTPRATSSVQATRQHNLGGSDQPAHRRL